MRAVTALLLLVGCASEPSEGVSTGPGTRKPPKEQQTPDAATDATRGDATVADAAPGPQNTVGTGRRIDAGRPLGVDSDWARSDDPDKIALGIAHSCVIDLDDEILCWGADMNGQLGAPSGRYTQIDAFSFHTCALAENRSVRCWGAGEPGEGQRPDYRQSAAPMGTFKEVATGDLHSCAIDMDDEIVCWGVGNPADVPKLRSDWMKFDFGQALPPAGRYRGLSLGGAHGCAIRLDDDRVVCWGGGTTHGACNPNNIDLAFECGQADPPDGSFAAVSAGIAHTCAITSQGSIECWGTGGTTDPGCDGLENWNCGQLRAPDPGGLRATRLSAGLVHSCALDEEGNAHCWGLDTEGSTRPPGAEFLQVLAGDTHCCGATATDNRLRCWGADDWGMRTVPAGVP